jgi:hypothetical protein
MDTRLVSLSVGVGGDEDFARTFQDLSELGRNLGVTHEYVSVSASTMHEDLHEEAAGEDLYFDENTLFKVRQALISAIVGLTEENVNDAINAMQNVGIVFRERTPG